MAKHRLDETLTRAIDRYHKAHPRLTVLQITGALDDLSRKLKRALRKALRKR
jgi:hypothetical protein